MTPHYTDPLVTLYLGDCTEVLRDLEADSVDSIVTDPPAGIAFMSKHWDRDKGGRTEWVAWMTEVMRECYRVLKPGGYALVWSIPRTCHWTAWAMEDAGFIIRDQLAHIFASGFPKGKAQLKPAREDWWLARKPGPLRPLAIDECRIGTTVETWPATRRQYDVSGVQPGGGKGGHTDPTGPVPAGRWPSNVLLSDPELFDEPNPGVVGSGANAHVNPPGRMTNGGGGLYEGGWGQHKPFGYDTDGGYSRFFKIPSNDPAIPACPECRPGEPHFDDCPIVNPPDPEHPSAFLIPKADRAERERGLAGAPLQEMHLSGGRTVNTSKGDGTGIRENKPRANVHPTVKPIDLMRHLVRLVTPPGGVTLDPFLGSGTTALAASEEGFRCIGIEREAEYLEIAVGRLMATPMGLGLDHEIAGKAPSKTHPDLSKHQPKRRAPSENYTGGWAGTESEDAA